MSDISGTGTRVHIRASRTFPLGFFFTAFADDTDPLDTPSIKIQDVAMGVNGDMVSWSTPTPILVTLNAIPNSDDDQNLATLLEANRTGKGKRSARDVITMTVTYPDGEMSTRTGGVITDGMPAKGIASAGRFKTNSYAFAFENQVRS